MTVWKYANLALLVAVYICDPWHHKRIAQVRFLMVPITGHTRIWYNEAYIPHMILISWSRSITSPRLKICRQHSRQIVPISLCSMLDAAPDVGRRGCLAFNTVLSVTSSIGLSLRALCDVTKGFTKTALCDVIKVAIRHSNFVCGRTGVAQCIIPLSQKFGRRPRTYKFHKEYKHDTSLQK